MLPTLTHFDSTIGSGSLTDHITERQPNPGTQNTFEPNAALNEDIYFISGLQRKINESAKFTIHIRDDIIKCV